MRRSKKTFKQPLLHSLPIHPPRSSCGTQDPNYITTHDEASSSHQQCVDLLRKQKTTHDEASSSPQQCVDPSRKQKARGPTLCLDIWGIVEGKRVIVSFNELGQPIGKAGWTLARFLGTVARKGELLPLSYSSWSKIPNTSLEVIWKIVLEKFDLPLYARDWVLASTAKKWKDWKAELKRKHYMTHETNKERLAGQDDRVLPCQWRFLVHFWNSVEGQKHSSTNKRNRSKQPTTHTAGSKSFARLHDEESKNRPHSDDLSRANMYILTHKRKNGQPMNDASAAIINQFRERSSQQPTQSAVARDDLFSQVVEEERRGRVRTFRLGPTPSDMWGRRPSRIQIMRDATEAKRETNEELHVLKEQMKTVMKKIAQLEGEKNNNNSDQQVPTKSYSHPFNSLDSQQVRNEIGTSQAPPQVPQRARSSSSSNTRVVPSKVHGLNEVLLLGSGTPTTIVAKGTILSKNPMTKSMGH